MTRFTFRKLAAATALASLGLAFGIAGTTAASVPPASGPPDSVEPGSLFSDLPADVQRSGVVEVAAVSDYPPFGFFDDDSELAGLNFDLLDAAAVHLGITFEYFDTSFDSLIPSIQAGRYLIGAGGAYDTVERQEAVFMVDFIQSGATVVVAPGNPEGIDGLESLCGHPVGVLAGSEVYLAAIEGAAEECETSGEPAIEISTFQSQDEAFLALDAGRVVATYDGNLASGFRIANGQEIEVVGPLYNSALVAFMVSLETPELAEALAAAIDLMIEDGTYTELLEKWGVAGAAVTEATINGTTE